jgi:uncharacterized protein
MFFDEGVQPLSETECHDLLVQTSVGRLSLSLSALPVVVPVHYGYLGGRVIIGINDGPVRRAVIGGNVIALGIDSADLTEPFWSVLAIGRANEISDRAQTAEFQCSGLTDLTDVTGTKAEHYVQLQPDIITGYRASDHR